MFVFASYLSVCITHSFSCIVVKIPKRKSRMLLVSGTSGGSAFGVDIAVKVRNVNYIYGCDGIRTSIQSYCSKGDYFQEIGTTEDVYHRTEIEFQNKTSISYRFQQLQRIKLIIYSLNSDLQTVRGIYGECQVDLGIIVASGDKVAVSVPNTPSTVEVSIDVPKFYSQYLRMKFHAHQILIPEPRLALYFVMSILVGDKKVMLYKSEIVKDHKSPHWAEFQVPLYILNFYTDATIELQCYNQMINRNDVLVGYCTTTLSQLQRGEGSFNQYMLLDEGGRKISEKTNLELKSIELDTGPSFFDLMKNNTKLHLVEAIDFTASNGNPVTETSLHFIHPHRPSPYIKSILDVTPPLLAYVSNPHNPDVGALGFGAQLNGQLSHCFCLNASPVMDHRVPGLAGLLDAYRQATLTVQPFGPTEFSDVIYFVSKFAKAESNKKIGLYFVLIIFSDGGPPNLKRTIDAIVDASPHPMSIIAIGVGQNKDFSKMKQLESLTLSHSDDRPLERQNYTFVEAEHLERSDVLTRIPLQMIQWQQNCRSRNT